MQRVRRGAKKKEKKRREKKKKKKGRRRREERVGGEEKGGTRGVYHALLRPPLRHCDSVEGKFYFAS